MLKVAVETRHLLLLVALDDLGSLHAAARALHLTPSALSQQLRELEDRIGGPLFERGWRRLTPTEAGRRLTDAARSAITDLARAEAETRAILSGTSGSLRVTTACHQSYGWLSDVLGPFAQAFPGVEVTVVTEAAAAPIEWLLARELDLALVAEDPDDPRIERTPLFRDELVAVVGRGHAWFSRDTIDVRAFATEHLFTEESALDGRAPLGRALAAAGNIVPRKLSPARAVVGAPIELARANLGVALMPRWTVEPLLEGGSLHAARIGKGLWLDWSAATRAEPQTPAIASFLEALRAHHPRTRAA
ncbi:Transcriptional activator MetR [Minicystis rosea]|nr:Transcriptional activator MetR [Minicystis rosea]